MYMSRGEC